MIETTTRRLTIRIPNPKSETDVEFKVICQQLAALAFVPIPSIRESFDLVVESIPQRYAAMLAPFLAYFQVPKILSTISSHFLSLFL